MNRYPYQSGKQITQIRGERIGRGLGFAPGEDLNDWYGGYSDLDYWYDAYFDGGGDWYGGYSDLDYWYDAYFGGGGDPGGGFGSSDDDLFWTYFYYYLDMGFDATTAEELAEEDAAGGSIEIITNEQLPLPNIQQPDISLPWWDTPYLDWMPTFDFGDEVVPPPPPMTYPNIPPCPPGTERGKRGARDMKCTPFDERTPAQRQQRQRNAQQANQRAQQQARRQQQQPPCKPKPGEWFNPKTRKCEPIPKCTAPGTVFDPRRGQCVSPSQLSKSDKGFPWWLLLLAGGVLLVVSKDRDDKPRRRARR